MSWDALVKEYIPRSDSTNDLPLFWPRQVFPTDDTGGDPGKPVPFWPGIPGPFSHPLARGRLGLNIARVEGWEEHAGQVPDSLDGLCVMAPVQGWNDQLRMSSTHTYGFFLI